MAALPVSLVNDTIVECVFEVRLSDSHPSAANLLPGLVFGKLQRLFKRSLALPIGQIPQAIRDQNPQLFYSATEALEGDHLRLMFGPRVLAVSFAKPYPGWSNVYPVILECVHTAFNTDLTGRPNRFSLKYINLLKQGRDDFDLSQTTLQLNLGSFQLRDQGRAVRAEILRNDCLSTVEIVGGAQVSLPGHPEMTGVMLTVDTMKEYPQGDYRTDLPQVLETLHTTEKEIFFGLLTADTLQRLGPRYASTH